MLVNFYYRKKFCFRGFIGFVKYLMSLSLPDYEGARNTSIGYILLRVFLAIVLDAIR